MKSPDDGGDRGRQVETDGGDRGGVEELQLEPVGKLPRSVFCMKPSNFIFTKWFVFEKNLPFMIAIRNFWHIWAFDSFLFSILCLI